MSISRRALMVGVTVLATASRARAQSSGSAIAYVGTYTPDGEGIYRVRADLTS